ncbi:Zonadhesin [Arthrobotrys entomopaga]|nr:Zonadhesin [Arthrobotrys entomopaga]
MGTATTEYYSTITPNVPGPITLIDYRPVIRIDSPYLAPVASTVTISPSPGATGSNRAFTIINYITRPRVTQNDIAAGPTGSTRIITQGTGPVTIIRLVPAVTIQDWYTGNEPSTSTITPTALGELFTIVHYDLKAFTSIIRYTRSTVTITQGGTSTKGYSSTLPIASGTGPITVVTFLPELMLANTYGIGGPSTVTIFPTGNEKVIKVIEYTIQPCKTIIVTHLPPPHGSTVIVTHRPPPQGSTVIVTHRPTPTTTVTSVGNSVYTVTITPTASGDPFTVIDYTTRSATTLTALGTSAFAVTLPPPSTAPYNIPITVIDYTTLARTTITKTDRSTHITTESPTDSTNISETVSIITYVAQQSTTVTKVGDLAHTTTSYPVDTAGSTLTDSGTITVIVYTVLPTVTVTSMGASNYISTVTPTDTADISGTFTVIDYYTQVTQTITLSGTANFETTLYPTDSNGETIISGTATVIDYYTQATQTLTLAGASNFETTLYPTDSNGSSILSGTVTIIDYYTQATLTTTLTGASNYETTLYPTDSNGATIISGTATVIDYYTQATQTITLTGASNFETTLYPTDSNGETIISGTVTIIDYYTQVTQTITLAGASDFETTLYPTDSNGVSILSGTATIITYSHPTYTNAVPVPCNKEGYIIGSASFISIDLLTGALTILRDNENAGDGFNSIGYNNIDGFVYGQANINGVGRVIRVQGNGAYSIVTITPASTQLATNCGEVDANGQYWIGAGGQNWIQINLNPNNGVYGHVISSGNISNYNASFGAADWVYIPTAGPYLWAFAVNGDVTTLNKWSTVTKKWQIDYIFPYQSPIRPTGGVFGDANGDLFFIVNAQGTIYKTNVFTKITPVLIGVTTPFGSLDAARCVYGNTVSDSAGDGDAVCTHEGLEVAIFNHPWGQSLPSFTDDPNWSVFDPTYFRTEQPYNQTITRSLGFNTAAFWNQPYGMTVENFTDTTDENQYALMYRGYFYVPVLETYTFTVTLGNNWVGVWLGGLASGNWTRANINIGALQPKTGTTPTALTNKVSVKLNAGQYYPIRVLLGNAGGSAGFGFSIMDSQGTYYARTAQESPYFVRYGCSGTPKGFTRAFGNETIT